MVASLSLYMYSTYNLGRNNMEQKPPYPPKSMLKSREEKNAPFCILDLGGRGGLSVPFKKSEIVVHSSLFYIEYLVIMESTFEHMHLKTSLLRFLSSYSCVVSLLFPPTPNSSLRLSKAYRFVVEYFETHAWTMFSVDIWHDHFM